MTERLRTIFIDWNFFSLLSSRFVSQLGDKLFIPAILWLALATEGGSTTRLGIVSLVIALPPLLSAVVGVYVDRLPKKRVLIACDVLRMILCVLLFVNQLLFHNFWVLAMLIFLIELAGQFFSLSSGSVVVHVVPSEQLLKANSYLSGTENVTSIIGFSTGGILIALFGTNPLLLANGVSFLLSALLLIRLQVPENKEAAIHQENKVTFFQEFQQGLRSVFQHKVIANLLLVSFLLNIATASLEMLMTIWAHDVLHAGAAGYGGLLTAILIGSLIGSFVVHVPFLKHGKPQSLISFSTMWLGIAFVLASLFDTILVSYIVFSLVGILFTLVGVFFSTMVMKTVPKENSGKVFGVIQTAIRGGHPLGVAIVTALLSFVSPQMILLSIGAVIVAGGLYLLMMLPLREQKETSPRIRF